MRQVMAAVVLAALAVGCSSASSAPAPTASATPSTAAAPVPSTTTVTTTTTVATTTTVWVPDNLLTGRDDGSDGPAVVVKVDNHRRAQPQQGLAAADLLVEAKVEGISRFMAVYLSTLPAEVGPVRSARFTDLDALGFLGEAVLAYSGANKPVEAAVAASPFVPFTEGAPEGAWRRERSRKKPHNLFVDPRVVREAGVAAGAMAPVAGFTRGPEVPGGVPAARVWVDIDDSASEWRYDGSRWVRHRGGAVHADADGTPVGVDALLVVFTEYLNPAYPQAVTTGEGRGIVLGAGVAHEVTWRRSAVTDPWRFFDAAGTEVPVPAGKVAMILAPAGAAGLG